MVMIDGVLRTMPERIEAECRGTYTPLPVWTILLHWAHTTDLSVKPNFWGLPTAGINAHVLDQIAADSAQSRDLAGEP